jgi:hypothetical protein
MLRLRHRVTELEAQLADVTGAIEGAREHDVEEAFWFAADYLRGRLEYEREWLRRMIVRIESKDLAWQQRNKK